MKDEGGRMKDKGGVTEQVSLSLTFIPHPSSFILPKGVVMRTLWQDLRYGVRMLLRKPGYAIIAVFTLALGIGTNTALFTVFDAFVLKPLPLKDVDSIVKISARNREGERRPLFSYPDYLDYRERNRSFSGLVAWNKVAVALGEKPIGSSDDFSPLGDGEYIFGQIVSGNYFATLGAEMKMGRGFAVEEDRTPGTHPVLVLNHGFWQRRFDADPNIIGQTIKLAGLPFTVIGVAAPEFSGTEPDAPQFWIPLMMRDHLIGAGEWNYKRWLTDRHADSFALIGRLKPGISPEQAESELSVIAEQLAAQYPSRERKTRVELSGAAVFVELTAELLPLVVPLLTAVGLILLIACANVANLLLARAAVRQKEMAVRLAMGAGRWRVIRQLLTESVLLSALGGAAGLLLAVWTLTALYPVVMSQLPIPKHLAASFALDLEPDYRVFGFALLVSFAAGIAAGLAPALQSSRPNLNQALKDEGSTFGAHLSQSRLRNALVVTQFAVCLALLIGAGLLVRNLQKVRAIDTGLETSNVFSVAIGSSTPDAEAELRRQLAARLKTLPGVKSTSLAFRQPLTGALPSTALALSGKAQLGNDAWRAGYNFVSPDHFATLGIRFTRGRAFSGADAQARGQFVVISEQAAHKFWPGEDPLGKRIGIGAALAAELNNAEVEAAVFPEYEVIGVVRDTRSGWLWQKDGALLYMPLQPDAKQARHILVQTAGDSRAAMALVRGEAEAIDPQARVTLRRVEDSLTYQLAPFRAIALLSTLR